MKALGVIDCSFPLDIAGRYAFKPLIGRMLLCLSYGQTKGCIRGPDLIFLDLNRAPIQSFSRVAHHHYSCIISLGLSLISSGSGYQSTGTGGRGVTSFNTCHRILTGSNELLLRRTEINKLLSAEKMPELLGRSSEVALEPGCTTTIKEATTPHLAESVVNISKIYRNIMVSTNILSLKRTAINRLFSAEKVPELLGRSSEVALEPGCTTTIKEVTTPHLEIKKSDTFAGWQNTDRPIINAVQRTETLLSLRNGTLPRGRSALNARPLSYRNHDLQDAHEDTNSSLPGIYHMKTISRGTAMVSAKDDLPYPVPPPSSGGHLIYLAFRNGSDSVSHAETIEKESIESNVERLPSRFQAAPAFDLNRLTDQIYSLIQRRIKLERERRGI